MITREAVASTSPATTDVSLRSPINWTATIFFACLGGLHFGISIPAFLNLRWEAYLSFGFGWIFLAIASLCFLSRYELSILPSHRAIRMRHGFRLIRFQRFIPFSDVHAVRLTLSRGAPTDSRIEILCDNEDIECPATSIPRQQALYLAVLIGVQLIKVSDDEAAGSSDRIR